MPAAAIQDPGHNSPSDALEPRGVGVVGAVDHDLVRLVGGDVLRRDVDDGRVCNRGVKGKNGTISKTQEGRTSCKLGWEEGHCTD